MRKAVAEVTCELPEMPDHIRELEQKLTRGQFVYCQLILAGNSDNEACRQAFPNATKHNPYWLNQCEAVQTYLQAMRGLEWGHRRLERDEKRAFLGDVMRMRVDLIFDDSGAVKEEYAHLVESIIHTYDKQGKITRTTYKFYNKLDAIKIDNQMAGHDAPTQVNLTVQDDVGVLCQTPSFRESLLKQLEAKNAKEAELTPATDAAPSDGPG